MSRMRSWQACILPHMRFMASGITPLRHANPLLICQRYFVAGPKGIGSAGSGSVGKQAGNQALELGSVVLNCGKLSRSGSPARAPLDDGLGRTAEVERKRDVAQAGGSSQDDADA